MPEWLALMPRGQQAQKGAEIVSYCQQSADLLNTIDRIFDLTKHKRMQCSCTQNEIDVYEEAASKGRRRDRNGKEIELFDVDDSIENHPLLQDGRPRYAVPRDHPNDSVKNGQVVDAAEKTLHFIRYTMGRLLSCATFRPLIMVACYFAFPPADADDDEIRGLKHMFNMSAKE